jgi:hypothetical protein
VGYGRVYGRKGFEDQFFFVGASKGPFHLGPLIGKTADGGYIIGAFGAAMTHPEGSFLTGTAGGGFYLVAQSAAACAR